MDVDRKTVRPKSRRLGFVGVDSEAVEAKRQNHLSYGALIGRQGGPSKQTSFLCQTPQGAVETQKAQSTGRLMSFVDVDREAARPRKQSIDLHGC